MNPALKIDSGSVASAEDYDFVRMVDLQMIPMPNGVLGVAEASKQIGAWPQANHFIPVCQPAQWQRLPTRVTMKPTGGEAATYDVVGTASILEEGDNSEQN